MYPVEAYFTEHFFFFLVSVIYPTFAVHALRYTAAKWQQLVKKCENENFN